MTTYKNAKGETKYYATYQSAWKAAAKLNEKEMENLWWFEADLNGWFLFQDTPQVEANNG